VSVVSSVRSTIRCGNPGAAVMGTAPQAPGTVSLRHVDAHLGTAGQVALRAGLGSRRPARAVPAPPALSVRGGARPGARGDQPARHESGVHAALAWTLVGTIKKVEDSFNFLWHVEQPRGFARRLAEYTSLLIAGPVLLVGFIGLSHAALSSAPLQEMARLPLLHRLRGTGI